MRTAPNPLPSTVVEESGLAFATDADRADFVAMLAAAIAADKHVVVKPSVPKRSHGIWIVRGNSCVSVSRIAEGKTLVTGRGCSGVFESATKNIVPSNAPITSVVRNLINVEGWVAVPVNVAIPPM